MRCSAFVSYRGTNVNACLVCLGLCPCQLSLDHCYVHRLGYGFFWVLVSWFLILVCSHLWLSGITEKHLFLASWWLTYKYMYNVNIKAMCYIFTLPLRFSPPLFYAVVYSFISCLQVFVFCVFCYFFPCTRLLHFCVFHHHHHSHWDCDCCTACGSKFPLSSPSLIDVGSGGKFIPHF